MSRDALAALDDAIRARAADQLAVGEQVVTWVVLVGTRMFGDFPEFPDGTGGTVVAIPHAGAMPPWEAKGIIYHYLDLLAGPGGVDDGEDPS